MVQKLLIVFLMFLAINARAQTGLPQNGPVDPDFSRVDQLSLSYLSQLGLPGMTVAIGVNDRVVYVQSYGWANREASDPATPFLEYRIASLSKTLTAYAVMRLVEAGRIDLDVPALPYLGNVVTSPPVDSRLAQVTVRQLLLHTWGRDKNQPDDPIGDSSFIDSGRTYITCRDELSVLYKLRLNFTPGSRYAYNNIGPCWLGVIAEIVDGRPLAQQLTELLGPEALSTGQVRVGSIDPATIPLSEPRYYDLPGAPQVPPQPGAYSQPPALVPRQYGGDFTLVSSGGSGGFVTSITTYMRFLQRLTGARSPALLQPATVQSMITPAVIPDGTAGIGSDPLIY